MDLLKVILPVIVMLVIGMICRERKLISPQGIEGLQALVMNFTLPISLFYTFYRASITADTVIFPVTFFVVTAGGIFVGRLLCRIVKEQDAYFPFTLTGYEAGMLGYALFGILLGSDKITQFALMDIGHVLAIFTVYVALVKSVGGTRQTAGEAIKGILTTPVLIGIVLGVVFSVTGIGGLLENSSVGALVGGVCEFVAAPTSAVILVVIGYRMNFIGIAWKQVSKVIVLRLVQQVIMAALVFSLFRVLGGVFCEPLTLISAAILMILPPPFILPLYIDGEEKKEFYSSAISVYTMLSIIGFMVLSAVVLG